MNEGDVLPPENEDKGDVKKAAKPSSSDKPFAADLPTETELLLVWSVDKANKKSMDIGFFPRDIKWFQGMIPPGTESKKQRPLLVDELMDLNDSL
jgi:hypothetical protein